MKQWYQDMMYARVIRMDGRVDRVQLDCMEMCIRDSSMPQARKTRRIKGASTLTEADCKRRCDTTVGLEMCIRDSCGTA